jgi:hypothetical protein
MLYAARAAAALLVLAAACSATPRPRSALSVSQSPAPAPAPADGAASSPGADASTAERPDAALDPDVAALPEGNGAKIALVIDDAGQADTYLFEYLNAPVPLAISIIPAGRRAAADDEAASARGKTVMLHIPLQNGRGAVRADGLNAGASEQTVTQFIDRAMQRVPHAAGANNHEGPYGSSDLRLMRTLLRELKQRGLFFMDSVTSQRTKGFMVERELGMPPRINNVFCDHLESDRDSRDALLTLARLASERGSAIGIAHVFHPYLLRAVLALHEQLRARGYVFAPITEVTNGLTPGLDQGVAS